ncbi:dTDP-4-amino-4,6-dideoxygalactose transaminase [Paradesertivirga mongoliensis]|uniref:dTDP-4-amino-4,6-dideoxygalactose transaminase n=1 Tax=Paradesertivirga mongoliensis TaxID=2100740 RepID=A0ABW4ZJ45_9SPHI|nr:dTDP-4-amino-4,6-dideoxygalactose transaminase [Pedobacter mongoliensis]
MKIPFNKPYLTGEETKYIQEAVASGKISGDGIFTKKCHDFFQKRYGFKKALLTTSCTDALEMAAILGNISPGDEVIAPSYTFVSTVNAFVLRGAKIIFCDSEVDHPNIDANKIEALITEKTRAIIPVHYAGFACDMHKIMQLAEKYNLLVIEDAAQAIDSYYTYPSGETMPLGSIGTFSAFSFHETKNIISGEGGMIIVNDERFAGRAEIIREKGTNRSAFFRGEVDKYGWVDIGSSFLPSDIISAFLYAQLENLERIQDRRRILWQHYHNQLIPLEKAGLLELPKIPTYATNNAHMFYIILNSLETRSGLIEHLRKHDVLAVFHYLSLHKSEFYSGFGESHSELPNSDRFTDCLLRMPLYYSLESGSVEYICDLITTYLKSRES